MPGKLIAIEGIDASGGTTQTRLLRSNLRADGFNVEAAKAPCPNSPFEPAIRALLAGDSVSGDPLSIAHDLFMEDRKWQWEHELRRDLEVYDFVVIDRWHLSTAVYRAAIMARQFKLRAADDHRHTMEKIYHQLCDIAPPADLNILIDVGVKEAGDRMASRLNTDVLEDDNSIQRQVRRCYSHVTGLAVVDGSQSVEYVAAVIHGAVKDTPCVVPVHFA